MKTSLGERESERVFKIYQGLLFMHENLARKKEHVL